MAVAGWWKRLHRDVEGNGFFWLLGIATGFAVAAACNQAAGKSVVEMLAVLVGAAAPVVGAVWLARRTERKTEDRRRLPLAMALVAIHNAAMHLDRAVSEALAGQGEWTQAKFAVLTSGVAQAHGDLNAFRPLADPFDFQVVLTMRRADEAYEKLSQQFDLLGQAPQYVNKLVGADAYRSIQANVEALMDRTGSAATDLLSITFRKKMQVGLAKTDR
jgi:hypothetical protein